MSRKWVILIVIVGVVAAAAIILPFVVNADQFRPRVESDLSRSLGRQVRIGHLGLSVLRGDLTAADISISDDPRFSAAPFVRARSLDVGIELVPLIFSRVVRIRSITLREPQVVLLRSNSGEWNFSSLGQQDPPDKKPAPASASDNPEISVQKLEVVDGKLTVGSSPRHRQIYNAVRLTAKNISYQSEIPFTLSARAPGGGQLQASGQAGPIDRRDVSRTPFQAKLNLKGVDLASIGFVDPSSGLAGTVTYAGTIRSDGKVARSEGEATIQKFRAVKNGTPADRPISIQYASDYNLARQTGRLTKGTLRTGKSTMNVSGTYDLGGESAALHMKLAAPKIPVQDIQPLLPAVGVTLPAGSSLQSGTADANLSIDGPIDQLVTTGNVGLSNAKLAGFSLGSKMKALAALAALNPAADTVIETLASNVRIAPQGIKLDKLTFVVPELGSLSGGGTIGENHAMNFKMVLKAAGGSLLANLAQRAGLGTAAAGGIPFLIQGTTADPLIVPDVEALLKERGASRTKTGGKLPQNLGNFLGGLLGGKKKQ